MQMTLGINNYHMRKTEISSPWQYIARHYQMHIKQMNLPYKIVEDLGVNLYCKWK